MKTLKVSGVPTKPIGHRKGEISRNFKVGWLTGLEPATTGITIRGSTN